MKILVIGLDSLMPELLFNDERLANFQRLAEYGCYGLIQGIPRGDPALAWSSMATGQMLEAPGQQTGPAIWEQLAKSGKRPRVVMPSISGYRDGSAFVYPDSLASAIPPEIYALPAHIGEHDLDAFKDAVDTASRRQFEILRGLILDSRWDYLQLVTTGLEGIQHAFWPYLDPEHLLYRPDNPYSKVIGDYYHYLDGELAQIFELLGEDTCIMLLSLESKASPDGSLADTHGFFILAGADNVPLGEIAGASIVDLAPTLLDLTGLEVLESLPGKSLAKTAAGENVLVAEDEELLRERLSGLGYV